MKNTDFNRFESTYDALEDCQKHWKEKPPHIHEIRFQRELLRLCADIVNEFGGEININCREKK